MQTHRPRLFRLVAASLLACGLLAACGPTENEQGASSSDISDDIISKLEAEIAPFYERPTDIVVDEPITSPIPTDKLIYFLTCNSPGCANIASAFVDAADMIGWRSEVLTVDSDAQSITEAYNTALRANPDGVAVVAVSSSVVQSQLDELESRGVPVVTSQDPDKPVGPIVASLYTSPSSFRIGKITADYMVVKGCTEGTSIYVQLGGFMVLDNMLKAFQDEWSEVAGGAKVEVVDVPLEEFAGAATRITGAVRANPDTSCIFVSSDPMSSGLVTALKGAGLEIPRIITNYGGAPTMQSISVGEIDSTFPPDISGDWGFLYADAFARAFTGQSLEPNNKALQPIWIIDKSNVLTELPYAYVPDLKEQYSKLWGLD